MGWGSGGRVEWGWLGWRGGGCPRGLQVGGSQPNCAAPNSGKGSFEHPIRDGVFRPFSPLVCYGVVARRGRASASWWPDVRCSSRPTRPFVDVGPPLTCRCPTSHFGRPSRFTPSLHQAVWFWWVAVVSDWRLAVRSARTARRLTDTRRTTCA